LYTPQVLKNHRVPEQQKAIRMFYFPPGRISDVPIVKPNRMLFTLSKIEHRLDEVVNGWFDLKNKIDPVIELFFADMYNPELYLEASFLYIAMAVESYHRRTEPDLTALPKEKFNEKKKLVLDAVHLEHRQWLKKCLEHANEPSFRQRIGNLLNKNSAVARLFIAEFDGFAKEAADTRNYLVHHTPKKGYVPADATKLLVLARKLRLLIIACLLSELGFDNETIEGLFIANPSISSEMSILRDH
jgi:hypothetical protein